MFKIWAKTFCDERIVRSVLYENAGSFDADNLFDYMVQICYMLDCPTPMVLNTHISNFSEFNSTRFLASDFVEIVNFEKLIIEIVAAK